MHVASPHLRPIIVAVASCALTACTVELGVTAQALTGDPVVDCPVVDPHAIAGHEATFYHCAEETLSCGPDGYLIGYGARYAERFYRHTRPWMSPVAKRCTPLHTTSPAPSLAAEVAHLRARLGDPVERLVNDSVFLVAL